MKGLVFGSDAVTAGCLRHLHKSPVLRRLELVTPEGTVTKGSEVVDFCVEHGIEYHIVPHGTNFRMDGWDLPFLSTAERWDVGILSSFGFMVPPRIIEHFRCGVINMHPSLLPQYRGAAPIPYALLNGDRVSGVTIMDVPPVSKIDEGKVLLQRSVEVKRTDTFITLRDRLCDLGGRMTCEVLEDLDGFREQSRLQSEVADEVAKVLQCCDESSSLSEECKTKPIEWMRTKKIPKEWSYVDWSLDSGCVYSRYRCSVGIFKNIRTRLANDKKTVTIMIDEMLPPESASPCPSVLSSLECVPLNPGEIIVDLSQELIFVFCGDGKFAIIKQIRVAPQEKAKPLCHFADMVRHYGGCFVPRIVDSKQQKKQRTVSK